MANRFSHPPTVLFVTTTVGRDEGACPLCHHPGIVGTFCYWCCLAKEQRIGTCGLCNQCGALGEPCANCRLYEEFEDEVPYLIEGKGACRACRAGGTLNALCFHCKDGISTFSA